MHKVKIKVAAPYALIVNNKNTILIIVFKQLLAYVTRLDPILA